MRVFVILILVVVIVAVVGYERGWFKVVSDNQKERIEVGVDKEQWHKDRDAFHQQAEARLRDLGRQLDELKAREATADAGTKEKLNQAISELSRKYQSAREQLNELSQSAEERWETYRPKLGQAMEDLKKGIDQAASRFH